MNKTATVAQRLLELASQLGVKYIFSTRPGVLVLTHIRHYSAPIESVKTEIEALYDGEVVLANDLDIF